MVQVDCTCGHPYAKWDESVQDYVCAECGGAFEFASDDEIQEDEFEAMLSECGMTHDGDCMLAGTEHCDWNCHINWNAVDELVELEVFESDGDKCPHCGSTNTERIDTISDDPVIWVCQCGSCEQTFEVIVQEE